MHTWILTITAREYPPEMVQRILKIHRQTEVKGNLRIVTSSMTTIQQIIKICNDYSKIQITMVQR